MGSQGHAPAAFTPEETRYPPYWRLGWASRPVWMGAEELSPTGIPPRNIQLVASRYTD